MTGSPNSSRLIPHQKNPLQYGVRTRCSSRVTSSRFRGVLPLKTGKWGARITINYKAHWLGTFELEEEAAIAYDRAAIKLTKTNSAENLPWKLCKSEEELFQSGYSDGEILSMIKHKEYSHNFNCFLARESIVRKSISSSLVNKKGMPYHLLFHKELTLTDVSHNSFHIPDEYAIYFPPIGELETGSVDLTFSDKYHGCWTFLYSYWSYNQTYVFTKGWGHFVTENSLKPGDTVMFYGGGYGEERQREHAYMIDTFSHVDVLQRSDGGKNMVENCAVVDGNIGAEKTNGVKIFGVLIG